MTVQVESAIEKLPAGEQQTVASGSVNDGVWESHELAMRDVYERLRIPTEPVEFPASCADAQAEIAAFRPA